MKKIILLGLCSAFALLFLGGCGEDSKPDKLVRIYIENPSAGRTGVWAKPLTMPNSGLTYYVKPDPLITEANITNVQLVQVQSGHFALLFHLDEFGTRALYRASVAENGRMLITTVNEVPIGARQIDGAISDGRLYTFTDLSEEETKKLYEELFKNQEKVQDLKRHHGY